MRPKYIYAGEYTEKTDIGAQLDFWYEPDPLGHAVIVWFRVPPHKLGTTYPAYLVTEMGSWVVDGLRKTKRGNTAALRYKLAGLEDL